MNKKRVLAMLLAGAMALSMTACGGGNSASTDGSSNDGGASASGGSYKVSVILKTLAAEYWQYVKSGAEDYASEHSDKVTVCLLYTSCVPSLCLCTGRVFLFYRR